MKHPLIHYTFILASLLVTWLSTPSVAQKKSNTVYVDEQGVMRWGDSKKEVHGFGVNYTAPFAHAYRAAKTLNVDLEKAIDADVYHFARLGFDAYRVHVWDTEISDSLGNLLEGNEHLRLFDYMLMKMKARGMKLLITPIAYWNNGYPEPDGNTPGFAAKYGKADCLTNEGAIRAQENYLYQFLNHVNPYTKVAYKDDEDLVAFEISNEPHHDGTPASVTTFINRMVKAMRKTGCKKPIFYNISHSIQLADAYFKSDIQGGTFQWYPTGLGSQHEIQGNFLPNVDHYVIPFANAPGFKKIAKVVYEFDAADVGRSYIYPAMARSFREAGIQWATHFAYDPTFMAYANTEYNTHYMNLVYAPQKALSLKIASEVFHTVPLYKSYGRYPANAAFDGFRVSYEQDLAEVITDKKFFHTNTTTSPVPHPETLEEIAGAGNSNLVRYEGLGAYFLDRLEKGVWRLEILPDAIWVSNVFGKNSLKKEVAVLNTRAWPMAVTLPDLGSDFSVTALNDNNTYTTKASNNTFTILPGTYLLKERNSTASRKGDEKWKNIVLKEFSAPAAVLDKTYVLHTPPSEVKEAKALNVEASVVSASEPEAVELIVFGVGRPQTYAMKRDKGYRYVATIPGDQLNVGFLRYYITVKEKDAVHTYPSGLTGLPLQWDFYDDNAYQVPVVSNTNDLYLFNAITDARDVMRQWSKTSGLMPNGKPGDGEFVVNVEHLLNSDPENKNGEKIYDYSFRYTFARKIAARKDELPLRKKLIVKGRALNDRPCTLQVALVMNDGTAYGATVTLDPNATEATLNLNQLHPVKLVTLPRPYPSFLPYYFESSKQSPLNLSAVEALQFSIGPSIPATELDRKHGVAIESVRLE
ncbi:cellulase family glycosylhydrolase [Chryseolinea lacunae]|uniref:Cellulase family glycosylhydrolase n=1 Tax=Chryseolinea lacunae TaxID=2801331 RepID=A0ABS1KP98_9BACT|nr:cellulase family glycosylhydrolase [Chryseolinea lacunae]MBL0740512.1 cellulase family glycosylhydrolase [Chryseolinea lacunae]